MKRKNSDYMSVQELSGIVNKSPQWIYKLMQKNAVFNGYTKLIDGKKRVHKSAIWQYFGIEYEGHKPDDGVMKEVRPEDAVYSALVEQLRAKDEQIRLLHDTIDSLTDSLKAEQLLRANADRLLLEYKKEPERTDEQTSDDPEVVDPEPERVSFFDRLKKFFS